jgi:hypothetical protein
MTPKDQITVYINSYCDKTGFEVPYQLRKYIVDMLHVRLNDCELEPKEGFGIRFLELSSEPKMEKLREYGDQCLFYTSLVPGRCNRRGIGIRYYCDLGSSAYHMCGDLSGNSFFTEMAKRFTALQAFLSSALNAQTPLALSKLINI